MIGYDRRGSTAWLTIERPDRHNALSPDAHRALIEALERAAEEARTAVVTGAGDTFCAGSDIETLRGLDPADAARLVEPEFRLYRRIESLSIPVVAAVNGPAYGGGVELVAACDLAVAVASSTFALPETRLGLTPGYALDSMPGVLGRKRVLELALTGEAVGAETARDWGLVNRVVDDDSLSAAVGEVCDRIESAPGHAIAAVKRTVAEDATESVSYQRSVDRLASLLSRPETQSRLQEFFE